ncbi:MAG: DUF1499 domain-containing protein [Xanthomonadales bacterium]|nr:DUF1499 domain-containing protein [Xanthomonadales bacterium]
MLLILAGIAWGGMVVFNLFSKPPSGLGVNEGRLAACPASPNCVSSQADPGDSHHIEPFQLAPGSGSPIDRIAEVIEAQPRARIVSRDEDYLHAEFTSAVMRFVDDVEFYAPPGESILHVRSASRIGYSDLGANRKRVELLRKQY